MLEQNQAHDHHIVQKIISLIMEKYRNDRLDKCGFNAGLMKSKCWMDADSKKGKIRNGCGVQKGICYQAYMSIFQTCLNLIIKVVVVVTNLQRINASLKWKLG